MRQLTRKGYNNYLQGLRTKISALKRLKISTNKLPTKLTYDEWQATYTATRNTLKEQVTAGIRKSIGNVNQYIISNQAYEFNTKQARAIFKAAKVTGQKLSLTQIRSGDFDWTQLNNKYTDLLAQGYTGKAAGEYISQYFFGSI